MKKYVLIFGPLALAVVIGSLTLSFAQSNDISRPPKQGKAGDFGPPPGGLDPRTLGELNLTELQKEQIGAFQFTSREASAASVEKVRAIDQQLQAMVESGNFNEEQATQLVNTKTPLMANLEIMRLGTDAAILKVLTAEQKTRLAQIRQQRRPPFPPEEGLKPDGQ